MIVFLEIENDRPQVIIAIDDPQDLWPRRLRHSRRVQSFNEAVLPCQGEPSTATAVEWLGVK
jgi:hypothetical protein